MTGPSVGGLPTGTVTFLFTDVVGSTALWELAPREMGVAMARHDAIIETVVAEHGGVVVRPRGEGDSRFVVFARASAAAAAAIGIVFALEHEGWSTPSPIHVRLAMHTGEAEVRDGDYYGSAVNRCARLRSLAHPGQMLVTQATAELVRGAHLEGAVLEDLGEHALRDVRRPERVYQLCHPSVPSRFPPLASSVVDADMAVEGRVVLPHAFLGRGADPLDVFVGRDAELDRLHERFGKITDGPAQLVLVSGEAGIGKTKLCTEFARVVYGRDATVLYGRCDEDLGVPYQPWIEALTHLVRGAPQLVARRDAGELAVLVSAVRDVLPNVGASAASDPETERFLLFGAVTSLLAAASVTAPLVIVLDDLHWADKSTLGLLRHLIASPVAMQVMVLGTYRDTDISRGDALSDALATLWRAPGVERLALDGLDDRAVLAMLEAAAGHELDDDVVDLAHTLRRDTAGNPFFAREIVRDLTDTGAIFRDEQGRWHANFDLSDARLPASVREVVGQRVARLSEDAQRVMSTAAVVGRDFDLDLMTRLTDRSEDDLLDVLDEAIASAVIAEVPGRVDRFMFAHALIQRTLYEDLGAARRGRAHRRAAEALEDMCGADGGDRVGELARHWIAASAPVQAAKAIDYARLAGDRALSALAPDEAIGWYAQGLELLGCDAPADSVRCDLLMGLGTAQRQVGDPAYRETLLEAADTARTCGDTARLVEAALANTRGVASSIGRVDHERIDVIEAALAALSDADSPERSHLMALLAAELTWSADQVERRHALAREAVAIAGRCDDPYTLVRVLSLGFNASYVARTLPQRSEWSRQAMEASERTGDPSLRSTALIMQSLVCLDKGEYEPLGAYVAEQDAIYDRLGEPELRFEAVVIRLAHLLAADELELASAAAERILESGAAANPDEAVAVWGSVFLACSWRHGDLAGLVPTVQEAIDELLPNLAAVKGSLACVAAEVGHHDRARAMLEAEHSSRFADIPDDRIWLGTMCAWAFVAAEVQHLAAAREILSQLARYHDQAIAPFQPPADGSVAHYLGRLALLLGDLDTATAYLDEAFRMHERIGCAYWSAMTDVVRAELLIVRASYESAGEILDRVTTIGEVHGFDALVTHAQGLRAGRCGREPQDA